MKTPQQGFTLIELMIVVAIIAILAAIAIPAYQDYTIRAQVSEGMSLVGAPRVAMDEYFSDHGVFPPSNASAGLALPAAISGQFVTSVDVGQTQGEIVITYGNKSHASIQNKTLWMKAYGNAGSVNWACDMDKTTVDPKYLPSSCRQ